MVCPSLSTSGAIGFGWCRPFTWPTRNSFAQTNDEWIFGTLKPLPFRGSISPAIDRPSDFTLQYWPLTLTFNHSFFFFCFLPYNFHFHLSSAYLSLLTYILDIGNFSGDWLNVWHSLTFWTELYLLKRSTVYATCYLQHEILISQIFLISINDITLWKSYIFQNYSCCGYFKSIHVITKPVPRNFYIVNSAIPWLIYDIMNGYVYHIIMRKKQAGMKVAMSMTLIYHGFCMLLLSCKHA